MTQVQFSAHVKTTRAYRNRHGNTSAEEKADAFRLWFNDKEFDDATITLHSVRPKKDHPHAKGMMDTFSLHQTIQDDNGKHRTIKPSVEFYPKPGKAMSFELVAASAFLKDKTNKAKDNPPPSLMENVQQALSNVKSEASKWISSMLQQNVVSDTTAPELATL